MAVTRRFSALSTTPRFSSRNTTIRSPRMTLAPSRRTALPVMVIFWASCSKTASSPVTIRSPSVIVTCPFASTLSRFPVPSASAGRLGRPSFCLPCSRASDDPHGSSALPAWPRHCRKRRPSVFHCRHPDGRKRSESADPSRSRVSASFRPNVAPVGQRGAIRTPRQTMYREHPFRHHFFSPIPPAKRARTCDRSVTFFPSREKIIPTPLIRTLLFSIDHRPVRFDHLVGIPVPKAVRRKAVAVFRNDADIPFDFHIAGFGIEPAPGRRSSRTSCRLSSPAGPSASRRAPGFPSSDTGPYPP